MITRLSLKTVAAELQGHLVGGDCQFERVSTDTRSVQAGDLFVALRGPRFDAHDYVAEAVNKQACGVMVERETGTGVPELIVDDTTRGLGRLAAINRRLFAGPLIAVTGSAGKTSIKTMLKNILSEKGEVLATRGNLNNHIGVPLTLFELCAEHDFAVIEMGASGAGEIAYLCGIARPSIAMVTNALRAHIEGFGSLEGVAKAKGEIFAALGREGTAVVNLDDAFAGAWIAEAGESQKLTFAVNNPAADFRGEHIEERADGTVQFSLCVPGEQLSVHLSLLGKQNVMNALGAAACAYAAGASAADIKAGLEKTRAVAGRLEPKAGIKGAAIIDDSYNANPDSVRAAIDALARLPGEKILVLGDMGELGPDGKEFHRELGAYAKSAGIPRLVSVGSLTRETHEAFGEGAEHFADRAAAIGFLQQQVGENTVVLIKGSRSSRMDEIVAALSQDEQSQDKKSQKKESQDGEK